MKLVAFFTDPRSIRTFLQHGAQSLEEDPLSSRPRADVPVDVDGREIQP